MFETFQFASVADRLATVRHARHACLSVDGLCIGRQAIQLGVEAIRRGETDAALCVGTDSSVQLETLIRFSLLSALSTRNDPPEKATRPFSKDRDGFVMAEGAGALVLESLDSARARGADILGVVRGCGEKADDYHRTRSKPDGSAIIGAIRNALADAGASADEIDYVNAHGTSTPENDKMEYLSLGPYWAHTRADPGQLQQIDDRAHLLRRRRDRSRVLLHEIREGVLPPTINYADPDPEIPLDVVPNAARRASIRTVLSNSFGFGGQNAALVLGAAE